jgi:hypothetical protein
MDGFRQARAQVTPANTINARITASIIGVVLLFISNLLVK